MVEPLIIANAAEDNKIKIEIATNKDLGEEGGEADVNVRI